MHCFVLEPRTPRLAQVHVAVTFIPIIDRNFAARFLSMPVRVSLYSLTCTHAAYALSHYQVHFLVGVHFDAFKDSTKKPTPMGKKQPRRSSVMIDSNKTNDNEWYLFSKHLSEEVLENFEIPERVSALCTRLLLVLISNTQCFRFRLAFCFTYARLASAFVTPNDAQVVLINLGNGHVTDAVPVEGSEIWSITGAPDLPAVSQSVDIA